MAVRLAVSLVGLRRFDSQDILSRYVAWWRDRVAFSLFLGCWRRHIGRDETQDDEPRDREQSEEETDKERITLLLCDEDTANQGRGDIGQSGPQEDIIARKPRNRRRLHLGEDDAGGEFGLTGEDDPVALPHRPTRLHRC